ncbi:cytochrome c oxidase assembly protein [Shouchella shacheensis]|uniref:cytochrome c oxidase assembly protein n=1 Tax=Shouchella shacheensis TaxID=1649580 RepID=UPI00073FB324|nr:cytochrome c oxidase assembly protein [Shouchella shacheensis]
MDHNPMYHESSVFFELITAWLFVAVFVLYIGAAMASSRYSHLRTWPLHRYVFWFLGVLCATASVVGPLADRAHTDFTAHMIGHLLLGMLAPLLLVLAAPMTLLLRTINVHTARRLSRVLKSWPVRIPSHPVVASILNIGGLWVLYTTGVYVAMQQNMFLHLVVHFHVFVAGYLWTLSMIYIDPTPHRFSFVYRAIVLVTALAGHGILSKYMYAQPPPGVPIAQAELGGLLMYYGGDAIDMVLIFILCLHWFKATRPRMTVAV